MTIAPPQPSEFNEYYARYIGKVPSTGALAHLKTQIAVFEKLGRVSDQDAVHRYAPDKWSVKEVVGHIADVERLFSYRLLHIARGDQAPLPGMDEKVWSAAAPHHGRPMADVTSEMIAIRHATIALVEVLQPALAASMPMGVADSNSKRRQGLCCSAPSTPHTAAVGLRLGHRPPTRAFC